MSIGKSNEVDETEEFQQKRLADFGATFTDKYANDWEFPRMQYKLILEDLQKALLCYPFYPLREFDLK